MEKHGLSIIVPTYNEAGNIKNLIYRIRRAMSDSEIAFEIIFIDDHSTDATKRKIREYAASGNISVFLKTGKKGKGYSLVEGATRAQYDYIAMLDADLQYPPEILPQLYAEAKTHGFAVANRKTYNSTLLRRLASRLNSFVFGRVLLNLKTDVQSGLKVFHRSVFEHLDPRLVSAWAIDIPLINTAYELGDKPGQVDIDFEPRLQGVSKINMLSTSFEIALGAIKTVMYRKPLLVSPQEKGSMLGSGLTYKRKRFITHTTLSHQQSALVTFTFWQQVIFVALVTMFVSGLILRPLPTVATSDRN